MPRRPAPEMLAAHQPKESAMASRREKLIYVLEGDFWGKTKSKGLIAKHAIGSIPIAFRGRALMVGKERIWLHPSRRATPRRSPRCRRADDSSAATDEFGP
jgi:hypothetical protein